MLAISDCLDKFRIANQPLRMSHLQYNPDNLSYPFLAHFKEEGGRFVLVNNIDGGSVSFSDENHDSSKLSEEEFLRKWDGILLYAEKNDASAENDYYGKKLRYFLQNTVLPICIITIIALIYLRISAFSYTTAYLLLLIAKMLGIVTSVVLIVQSIDSNNPLIKNLCGGNGKNDCNAILKSDASKLYKDLSWSEVGLFYFTGTALLLLLTPQNLTLLAWLNIVALPYTLYSFGYQYYYQKWCMFCCLIQILLLTEFMVNILSGNLLTNFSLLSDIIPLVILCGTLPILIWYLLKPFFLRSAQLEPLNDNLRRFKYNRELFNLALTNQARFEVSDNLSPIKFGNPNAEIIITMVSNPFCNPCGRAHEKLLRLIKNRNDIRLNIIFSTDNGEDDPKAQVARHLIAISKTENIENLEKAFGEWYNTNSKNRNWSDNLSRDLSEEMEQAIENQRSWCDMVDIQFTPTILINGYKLPEPYRLDDIEYLIL